MSNRHEKERRRQARERRQAQAAAAARRRSTMRFVGATAGALAVAGVLIAVALSSQSSSPSDSGLTLTPVQERAAVATIANLPRVRSTAGSKALADLRSQRNEVIDDSISARLAALKGVPVVVNMWASWCPNCRAEFGYFQALSKAYAGKVAFVGLDSNDSRSDAQSFLKRFPIPYPSINDPSAAQARSIGAGLGWPTTVFYDARGERQFARQGGYTTQASLDADIRAYAAR